MSELVLRFPVPPDRDAKGRPQFPPKGQNALDAMHWAVLTRYKHAWQDAVLTAWRQLPAGEQVRVAGQQVTVALTIPVTTARRRDAHGWVALFKLVWDGLRCPEPRKGRPSCRATWPQDCAHPWPDDDERYLLGVPAIAFEKGASEVVLRITTV